MIPAHPLTPDYLAEVVLLETSRLQREAFAFHPTEPTNPSEEENEDAVTDR